MEGDAHGAERDTQEAGLASVVGRCKEGVPVTLTEQEAEAVAGASDSELEPFTPNLTGIS